jgi:hypothetical protein
MLYRPLGSLGFYLGHEYTKRFNPANMSVFSKPKSSAFIGHDAFTRVPPRGPSAWPVAVGGTIPRPAIVRQPVAFQAA